MRWMTMTPGVARLVTVTMAAVAAAGCSPAPVKEPARPLPAEEIIEPVEDIIDPVIEEDPPPLPTLLQALSESDSFESIEMKELDWLRSGGRWTDADFEELHRLLDDAFSGEGGISVSGVDGATVHPGPEGDAKQLGIAARGRNWLLADYVARGDVAFVRDFVRTHRKIPSPMVRAARSMNSGPRKAPAPR